MDSNLNLTIDQLYDLLYGIKIIKEDIMNLSINKWFIKTQIKIRIKRESKEKIKKILKNYDEILKKYINEVEEYVGSVCILFRGDWGFPKSALDATSLISNTIVLNVAWATQIILHDNNDTKNAFLITIGHELTHKEPEYPCYNLFGSERKFSHWVQEVHADFSGTLKLGNSKRKNLVESCEYKKEYKESIGNKDKDSSSHPSWKKRIEYAKHYNFNTELIKQIALDVNCKNQKLIDKVCDFYDEIILDGK